MTASPYLMERVAPLILDQAPLNGVAAGQTARSRLAVGPTYLELWLYFEIAGTAATEAQIKAQVSNIRLTLDGKPIFEVSATHAAMLAEFYETGILNDDGYLPIMFHRPWLEVLRNQDALGLGTVGVNSLQVEVTLAGGATINKIVPWAKTEAGGTPGEHIRVHRLTRSFGSTGEDIITDLPRNMDRAYYAVHIASANIDQVEVLAENSREIFAPPKLLNRMFTHTGRTVQAGYTHLDFIQRNRHADRLKQQMNDLQLRLNWTSAPGTYDLIIEEFQLDNVKRVA